MSHADIRPPDWSEVADAGFKTALVYCVETYYTSAEEFFEPCERIIGHVRQRR